MTRPLGVTLVCLLVVVSVKAQERPLMAEDVFKNIQVLKGIPVREFMNTMGFFSAATNLNCVDCHSPQSEDLAGYAIDTPRKQTARRMVVMVNQINQANFGGRKMVTCYTCHRASDRPEAIPSLLDQYSVPEDDPNRVEVVPAGPVQSIKKVSADQILDKYLQAIGGAAQAAKLTSLTARGTYEGYDTLSAKVPVDIFANAPNQMTMVVHTQNGDSVTTYDGRNGWIAAADKLMRVLPLDGGDLEGAKMDAALSFPARIKQDFQWRTGFPSVSIDDQPVDVIQNAARGATGAKLYFDSESGLLVRQVRFVDTAVGVIPTQIDYSDYRDVAGVKVPFKRVITWTDGRSTIELSQVQPNVRIQAAQFAKPAAPKPKTGAP
ncbi:MAG TPA: photosynthetic reaction center cytochrome c subunit family protein [Vicinamibacterales bacterium]|jgi:outer membrane lipoprotein-sorting protein|nr:photosynthetic reaction center cytochrome c subunit family protein [Vicinamibacterales bacterium]